MLSGDTSNVTVRNNKGNHRTIMEGKEERGDPDTRDLLHVLIYGQPKISNLILQGQQLLKNLGKIGVRVILLIMIAICEVFFIFLIAQYSL